MSGERDDFTLGQRARDSERFLEEGWIAFLAAAIPTDTPPYKLTPMRMAYFNGASHIFGLIAAIMEAGDDATEEDVRDIGRLHAELHEAARLFKVWINRTPREI